MSLRTEIKEIKTIEEVENLIKKELKSLITLWAKVYPDYDGKFSEQIKAYKYGQGYLVIVRNFNGTSVESIDIYFTSKKPTEPHPVFPVPHSYMTNFTKYSFKANNSTNE